MNDYVRPNPTANHLVGRLAPWTHRPDGTWTVSAPVNGEDGAFVAFAYRVTADRPTTTRWAVECHSHGRRLDLAHGSSLAAVKHHAQATYDVVEGVNL
jgi:hypothetical protein